MQACLQMTERERIIQIRKPPLDKSFVPRLLYCCIFLGTEIDDEGEQIQARRETVVYAGTQKNLNATWWGKKVE